MTVYEVRGANGTALFRSRREAERVVNGTPRDWGAAVGGGRPTIREVRLFDTAEEWKAYEGAAGWNI